MGASGLNPVHAEWGLCAATAHRCFASGSSSSTAGRSRGSAVTPPPVSPVAKQPPPAPASCQGAGAGATTAPLGTCACSTGPPAAPSSITSAITGRGARLGHERAVHPCTNQRVLVCLLASLLAFWTLTMRDTTRVSGGACCATWQPATQVLRRRTGHLPCRHDRHTLRRHGDAVHALKSQAAPPPERPVGVTPSSMDSPPPTPSVESQMSEAVQSALDSLARELHVADVTVRRVRRGALLTWTVPLPSYTC